MDVDVYWSNRSRNCSQIIKTYCCCSFSSLACTRTRAQWIQILACNRERICLLRVMVCANRITLFVYRVWCTEVMWCAWAWLTVLCSVLTHSLIEEARTHTHTLPTFDLYYYLRARFHSFLRFLFILSRNSPKRYFRKFHTLEFS